MTRTEIRVRLWGTIALCGWLCCSVLGQQKNIPAVVYLKQASELERLAAKELQRYLYLRTGALPVLKGIAFGEAAPARSIIVASIKTIGQSTLSGLVTIPEGLKEQAYWLQSVAPDQLWIVGGSEVATLYGAYQFLRTTGIGFSVEGDYIPDKQTDVVHLSGFRDLYESAFAQRGILPFSQGPDGGAEKDYQTLLIQLPKIGMNSLVLPPEAIDSAANKWPVRTSDFSFGASQLFESDTYPVVSPKRNAILSKDISAEQAPFQKRAVLSPSFLALARRLQVKVVPLQEVKVGSDLSTHTERSMWKLIQLEDPERATELPVGVGKVLQAVKADYPQGDTNILGILGRIQPSTPAVMALMKAVWQTQDLSPPLPEEKGLHQCINVYGEWARQVFGANVADTLAHLFMQWDTVGMSENAVFAEYKDSVLSARQHKDMDRIEATFIPWQEQEKDYTFVADYEQYRSLVRGAGHIERFDYWLHSFQYARTQAKVSSLLGEMQQIARQLEQEKEFSGNQLRMASLLLDLRTQLVQEWSRLSTLLLQMLPITGDLDRLARREQRTSAFLQAVTAYDSLLSTHLGTTIPEIRFPQAYTGKPQVIVTDKRRMVSKDENLKLPIRILTAGPVESARIYWRALGKGTFTSKPLTHVANQVYTVALTSQDFKRQDFEYFIQLKLGSGTVARYPASPATTHTVVVW